MQRAVSFVTWGRAVLLAALTLVLVPRLAWADFTPPPIQGYVTDTAGKLSAEEVRALDEKLAAYRRCAGDQIAVLVTQSLGGSPIEDVGFRTATAWKLGEAGKDNGVLLVIAPNERKVRIEIGKGLEGQLTDLGSNDILREHVSPNLKKDDFFAAVDDGTSAIAAALWAKGPHASCASIAHATRPKAGATRPATPRSPAAPQTATPESATPVSQIVGRLAFFVALFALTWTGGRAAGCFPVAFSFFFGAIGAAVIPTVLPMVVGGDLECAVIGVFLAVVIVGVRTVMARRPPSPFHRSGGYSSSSSASDAPFGPSYGGGSSGGDFSSGSSGSSDSGFSGGGGGSFGGGGSSDSY